MSLRLVAYNDSKDDRAIRLKCGYTEVVIEKGEIKTIVYNGDGVWSVEVEEK